MPGNETTAKSLGYAGLIPFIVFSIGSWFQLPMISDSTYILTAYAAIILSFMGAIHWGIAMSSSEDQNGKYFIASVIPGLSAWLALLMPQRYAIILLMVGFIALIIYDWSVEKPQRLPGWYIPMRNRLTLVVVMCLMFAQLSLGMP
ncbi:MAG: DUF3429 domain-containing protein [Gammaproteobacteria bacterium]|nr:DUF3429 domain-containing protein [Gammaproteobacteria bacterium]